MLSIKPGASVFGLRPETLLGVLIAERIWAAYGIDLVLTEGSGGKHSETSLHNSGCAADLRSRDLGSDAKAECVRKLKEALGRDYDVVVEDDHIHLEYQPRSRVT